jgi:hypothetical protein
MVTTSQYPELIRSNLINQPMFIIDPLRPTAGEFVFQRFWFSNATEWIA